MRVPHIRQFLSFQRQIIFSSVCGNVTQDVARVGRDLLLQSLCQSTTD